jgi:hypothetical protein
MSTTTLRVRRIVNRISATLSELDYAQRRLLEVQSGTSGLTRRRSPRAGGHDGVTESRR